MKAIEVFSDKSNLCREILDDLPEWFGIPAAKDKYVSDAAALPMFACFVDNKPVAFVSLKQHTLHAAELYVLGVQRRYHGQGFGRAIIGAALDFAVRGQLKVLTVKTIAATNPDPHYSATRGFYEAMGFFPIEVFADLWSPANPCLLMMRTI